MGYGYTFERRDLKLPGVPFSWNTNLCDEDIFDLYALIQFDSDITEPSTELSISGIMSIPLHFFDKFVPFKEGLCHCIGVNDTIYAVYKSHLEWEIWTARQLEIKELKEEQEFEKLAQKELLKAEEAYLTEKCRDLLENKNFDGAYKTLCSLVDLFKSHDHGRYTLFLLEPIYFRLIGFPIEYSLRFLEKYECRWYSYTRLAGLMSHWFKTPVEDIKIIFESAIRLHEREGLLFKDICLFWERQKKYSEAIFYCQKAIALNLKDDTKLGFPRRLKRLQGKARRIS